MKGLRIFFLFGVIILLGILLGCEETIVSHKPQDQRIVFYSNRTDSTEVFVMEQDGSNQERVTPSGLNIFPVGRAPLWSPDKEEIAFACLLNLPMPAIMLINPDGTGLDTLVLHPGGNVLLGDWSPNENQIVYSAIPEFWMPPDPIEIFIINSDGTGNLKLDDGYQPRFCGNNKVVYTDYYGGGNIFIINTDGTGKKQLTDVGVGGGAYHMPVGSPDGRKIAFERSYSHLPSNPALGIMNSDSSGETLLVSGLAEGIAEIEFSPNGQRILFLTDNGDNSEICVINIDGTGLDSLTGGIACGDGGASWSPDGEWIAFTSNRDGNKNIYRVSTDGRKELVQLTDNPADDFNPDW
ncbi:MAG TPA: DUF5050 domain-containing protein [candidate division Zixibacteria bacterium]